MKPETQEWLKIAERDLGAAQMLLRGGFYAQAIFCSQQAVEKCLKALWVEQHTIGFPPRIHDLIELLDELDFDLPEWRQFLADLSRQAVASRYEDPDSFTPTKANDTVQKANELCELLRQKLT